MDPISLGLLLAMGAGGAAALARWRNARKSQEKVPEPATPHRARPRPNEGDLGLRVGDVILYLGEEFWLAGELSLQREGSAVLRLFQAPDKGKTRWVAVPRQGDSYYVLEADAELARIGWPGMEVPLRGRTLRPVEQGACAVAPSGELESGWEGLGRYAVFRALETVAVVLEQGSNRLWLSGKMVPKALTQRLGA